MFEDPTLQRVMRPFDWLRQQAVTLASHFPGDMDRNVIGVLKSLQVQRHLKNSCSCGFYEGLFGRVIFCMSGKRIYIGAPLEPQYKLVRMFCCLMF